MGRLPSVDIVIVNRNSGYLLRRCLASIAVVPRKGWRLDRLYVVDDASTDGSASGLEHLSLPITCLTTPLHTGYGRCCNMAAKRSSADYLLFLNTDIRMTSDPVAAPVAYLEDDANRLVGICGIKLREPNGSVARSASRFPNAWHSFANSVGLDRILPSVVRSHQMLDWDHETTRPVDQVIGAFMLIRRELFARLDGYDERFFVYMEDLDLALRARQLGFSSVYLSSVEAEHLGGGTADRRRAESLFFNSRSRIQYAFKHFSLLGAWLVTVGVLLVEPVTRSCYAVVRGQTEELAATVLASLKLWRSVPKLLLDAHRRPPIGAATGSSHGSDSLANR